MRRKEISQSIYRIGMLAVVVGVLVGCAAKSPAPVRDATRAPAPSAPVAAVQGVGEQTHHVVQPGDTLLGISRQYGQSVADLVAWNGLSNPNQITVGQRLRVAPATGAVAETRPVTEAAASPSASPGSAPPVAAGVLTEPKGGRQPYSDQAWAAVQGRPAVQAPTAVPPQPAVPGAPAIAASGDWAWPIASGEVLLGFEQPKGENGKLLNKGLDIGASPGTPVLAAAPGTVMYAGSGLRGFGKLVIIRHEADYQTVYAHNQALLVKEGETVTRGQKIAEVGSTDADRPMLHFEIRRQGRPLDPMKYLPAR